MVNHDDNLLLNLYVTCYCEHLDDAAVFTVVFHLMNSSHVKLGCNIF